MADAWAEPAKNYRAVLAETGRARLDLVYGDGERNRFDLFLPEDAPKGLVVFVHGGYWVRFDKSYWSHLARGSVEHGYAVAMPVLRAVSADAHLGDHPGDRRGDRRRRQA